MKRYLAFFVLFLMILATGRYALARVPFWGPLGSRITGLPPDGALARASGLRPSLVTRKQALRWAQTYLTSLGNPNLKLGDVKESEAQIEVQIVTKDNSLVERIWVDKRTGWATRAF